MDARLFNAKAVMGDKTMFDLNQKITKWLNGLGRSEVFEGRDIAELEGHLREETEHLTALGLSEQEAFLVARQRLGDTATLEDEFAKVNSVHILRNRLFWMVAGMLAYLLAKCLAGAAGNGGALAAHLGGFGAYSSGLLGATAGALAFGIMLLLAYLVCRRNMKTLSFDRLASDLRGKIVLIASLVVMVLALGGVAVLFSVLMARTMSLDDMGRLAHVSAYVRLILRILLPVVLMVLLIRLRSSNVRAVPE